MYARVHAGDRLVALGFAVVAILAASLGLLGGGTGNGRETVRPQISQIHDPENLLPPSLPPPAQLAEADRQIAKFLLEREPEFLALEFGGVRWGEKDGDEMSPAKVISFLQSMRSGLKDQLTINDICYIVSQYYAISIATTESGGAHLSGNDAKLKAGVETLLKKLRERAQDIRVVAINQSSQRVSLLIRGEAQLLTKTRQSFPYQLLGACELRSGGGQLTLMRDDSEAQLALPIKAASRDVKEPTRLEFPDDRLYVKWSLSLKTGELSLIVYDLSVKGR